MNEWYHALIWVLSQIKALILALFRLKDFKKWPCSFFIMLCLSKGCVWKLRNFLWSVDTEDCLESISHDNDGTFPIDILENRHISHLFYTLMNRKIWTIFIGNFLSYDEKCKAWLQTNFILHTKKTRNTGVFRKVQLWSN